MPVLLHLVMISVWGLTLVSSTRRLLRLAKVAQLRNWEEETRLRRGWNRIWWWLGQDTFWAGVRIDALKAIEISLIIFLIAWGMGRS